jgi:hypothetical protein
LLSPERFEWAKSFLNSQAWKIILKGNTLEASVQFVVPQLYPVPAGLVCSNSVMEIHPLTSNEISTPNNFLAISSGSVTTSNMHLKRNRAKVPLVETKVRRSERLKEINKGFKSSSCPNKNCFCCHTIPPTLSSKVIRSMGKDLCNIPLDDLTDEVLKKKPLEKKDKSVKLIQPKAVKSTTNFSNDDKPKKKRNQK